MTLDEQVLALLRCPETGERLHEEPGYLVSESGASRFKIGRAGIPLFAERFCSPDGRTQQAHYDRIATTYLTGLEYPHTREYMAYLDREFIARLERGSLGAVAELCCGRGEAFHLLQDRVERGVGVDVSEAMLEAARGDFPSGRFTFLQADATQLPLAPGTFDHVIMLGGIHHVNDRRRLFAEVFRILKAGGRFCWREPVSDFVLWRLLRAVVYRISPTLDHLTEHPLRYHETVPLLQEAGFRLRHWGTCGFAGFCALMNSDVLVINRLLRFLPGIRGIARAMARIDALTLRLPGMSRLGTQVVGVAERPGRSG